MITRTSAPQYCHAPTHLFFPLSPARVTRRRVVAMPPTTPPPPPTRPPPSLDVDDDTPTKSAFSDANVRASRTPASRRYADVVPGGVRTRVGSAAADARDRALNSRAEALRRALRHEPTHDDEARARETREAKLYEYASVLQEQAERCGAHAGNADDGLREELTMRACDAYRMAWETRPGRHGVVYNWGIALGDRAERASARGDTEKARALWDESIDKYERATRSREMATVTTQQATQGLNNLGLAYQSRAACVDLDRASAASPEAAQRAREERVKFLSASVRKFRRALRLDPSFDRAVYNLGTVVYALSSEYASMARLYPQDETLAPLSRDYVVAAATYVGLALASEPQNDVYATSYGIVKNFAPAPYIVDETFSVATDRADGSPLDFVNVRLVLTPNELRTHPDVDDDVVMDVPVRSIAAIEPLEDVTLPSDGAAAALHLRDAGAAVLVLTHANARVRDRAIDAIIILRDLARRGRSRAVEDVRRVDDLAPADA